MSGYIGQGGTAITGGTGYLGSFVLEELLRRQQVISITREPHPLLQHDDNLVEWPADEEKLTTLFEKFRPRELLHIAALSSAALCEKDPEEAHNSNVVLTEKLVRSSRRTGCKVVYASTDLVFEGADCPPGGFKEQDRSNPLSIYARTKWEAEKMVLDAGGIIVRLSLFVGPKKGLRRSPLGWMQDRFEAKQPVELFEDEWRTPIFVGDAARALIALRAEPGRAIFHCGGPERVSRVQFGSRLAELAGYDSSLIVPLKRCDRATVPPRPKDVSLDSTLLWQKLCMRPVSLDQALSVALVK